MHDRRRISLGRNYSWTFVSTLLAAACQWGILAVLTKICPPDVVGQFTMAFAVCVPVVTFAALNLRAILATDACGERTFGDYLGLRLFMMALACVVIATIAITLGFRAEMMVILALVTLAKLFDYLSDIVYGLAQRGERMDFVAVSRIVKGGLQLATFGVLVAVTRQLWWGLLGMSAASGVVLALYDIPAAMKVMANDRVESDPAKTVFRRLCPRWSAATLLRMTRLTLPLGLVAMCWNLVFNIPRYAIEHSMGQREVAIFSAMAYIMNIAGDSFIGSMVQSAYPRLAHCFLHDLSAFKRLLTQLIGFGAAIGLAGALFAALWGRHLLTLLYSREYGDYPGVFVWMMASTGIMGVLYVLEGGLVTSRKFDIQVPLGIVVIIISALGCFGLVPRFGLLGATWGMMLGMLARMLGYGFCLLRVFVEHKVAPDPARMEFNATTAG